MSKRGGCCLVGGALLAIVGCSSGPGRIVPPSISPTTAARAAMKHFDADNDGFLDAAELEKAPGLKAALLRVDADSDGKITADEIAARIQEWQAGGIAITSIMCLITLDGQPLPEATVTFEPEEFLGENLKTATAETTLQGMAAPSVAKEERPAPHAPPGLALGFYRVKVSKLVNGRETIPAKYNTETILGQEIALDDPALMKHRIVLNLTSR